jgi:hypothetical protein
MNQALPLSKDNCNITMRGQRRKGTPPGIAGTGTPIRGWPTKPQRLYVASPVEVLSVVCNIAMLLLAVAFAGWSLHFLFMIPMTFKFNGHSLHV